MPKKSARHFPAKREPSRKSAPIEQTQHNFTPGAGWNADNLAYLKSISSDQVIEELYKMFGIPKEVLLGKDHDILQAFIEYEFSSFSFVKQIQDPEKSLMCIAILTDLISNMPNCQNLHNYFSQWHDTSNKILEDSEFTDSEIKLVQQYISQKVYPILPMLNLVFTRESVDSIDSYGLFKPVPMPAAEERDIEEDKQAEDAAREQAALAEALLAQKQAEEVERQKQEALAEIQRAIEESNKKIAERKQEREERLAQITFEMQASLHDKKHHKK